jgi:SAM-dependent methyltransferase
MSSPFRDRDVEEVRAYWDRRPCNLRHSTQPVGERTYFDEVERRKYFVEPHIPGFADFPAWKERRVLEIGCGLGTDTIQFARAGAHVTAVDLSPVSLDLARRRAAVYGLEDRIRFLEADVERLEERLPPGDFELVYGFGTLHHTPRPDAALRALRRQLADEGTLKLMMYHRRSWKVLRLLLAEGRGRFWDLDGIVARGSEAQTGCPVTYSYTRRSLARLLRDCGFEPQEMRVEHLFPWRIPEYVRHEYRKEWYFAAMPKPVFHWLECRVGWHLCVTARPR